MKTKPELRIYDNTLRDGEQTVGVCFSPAEKVLIARQLAATNIRAFEAGFAGVSEEEEAAILAVTEAGLDAEIYSLARLRTQDIDAARRTGVHGVTLIAPVSDVLIRARRKTPEDVEREIVSAVGYAKRMGLGVRFSCVDASRTPLDRLLRWYLLAREAGADWISYADTVGAATPESVSRAVGELKRVLRMPVSMHAHNDLGLAVANSLAAMKGGADEVQVTVNGLGERAGNTPMEEFVLALKAGYRLDPGVDLHAMMELSGTLNRLTGLEPAVNKPIIGKNAFRHESGIHVQGLLQAELPVFEPFPPEWIGRRHEVAFGKHSGKSNLRHLCREYGIALDARRERLLLRAVKHLAQENRRELEKAEILQFILKPWRGFRTAGT